jgi:hypothetical protein
MHLLLFIFGLLYSPSGSGDEISPNAIYEHGFLYVQRARLFAKGSLFIFFREKEFLAEYPQFQKFPLTILRQTILENYAYLTEMQMDWQNILMDMLEKPDKDILVWHPPRYVREPTFPLNT